MAKLIVVLAALCLSAAMGQLFGPDADLDRAMFTLKYNDEEGELGYRLPNDTIPARYDLELTTNIHLEDEEDPAKFQFDGKVLIHIVVVQATKRILLHSRRLTIKNAELWGTGEEPVKQWTSGEEIPYDETYEFLVFEVDTDLVEGDVYTLEVNFSGEHGTLSGFYRASYIDEDGKRRWLATTQFESTSARQAFPCYDEPGLRAPIGLTLIHTKSYFAISNMPVKAKTAVGDDYTSTTFLDTPPMQTYLLAFVVSDFSFVAVHANVPQRVFARKQVVQNGDADFAVRAGVKILDHLDEYVYHSYGTNNPKMDQIGIPDDDFSAGAMENWGLVTYKENALFYNEKNDRTQQQQRTAGIIAHEYAHQYFGNWVSPKWWSYLWLNEGFAALYQYWLPVETHPNLDTKELYILANYQPAMTSEALGVTRPMTHYVETPRDISSLFDVIAYDKSSAVLRMLSFVMTEDIWRKGLDKYLTTMENKAADSDDLAAGLQAAVDEAGLNIGQDVNDIIDSWSLNAGVPVLHVSLDTEKNELKFEQARFLSSKDTVPRFKNDMDVWLIPVWMLTASKPKLNTTVPQFWVTTRTATKTSGRDVEWAAGDWVLVNVDAAGYYRVHYDEYLLDALIAKLDSDTWEDIPLFSRTQLIDDAFAFGKADKLDYVTIFRLLRFLSKETNYQTWTTAGNGLAYLNNLLSDSESAPYFRRFVNELVTPLYKHTGIKDLGNTETLGEKRVREIAVDWACRTGDQTCLKEAKAHLESALRSPTEEISPNIRGVLECAALRQVTEIEFDAVWLRMQVTKDAGERSRLITALGCSENSDQQVIYLNSTIVTTGAQVPNYTPNERLTVLRAVYRNERNGLLNSIEFLLENYAEVKRLYVAGAIANAVTNMAGYVSSEAIFDRYNELLIKGRIEGDWGEADATRLAGIAQLNLKWIEDNEQEVQDYFGKLYNGAGGPAMSALLITIAVGIASLLR